jgi:hypothetical protein
MPPSLGFVRCAHAVFRIFAAPVTARCAGGDPNTEEFLWFLLYYLSVETWCTFLPGE